MGLVGNDRAWSNGWIYKAPACGLAEYGNITNVIAVMVP